MTERAVLTLRSQPPSIRCVNSAEWFKSLLTAQVCLAVENNVRRQVAPPLWYPGIHGVMCLSKVRKILDAATCPNSRLCSLRTRPMKCYKDFPNMTWLWVKTASDDKQTPSGCQFAHRRLCTRQRTLLNACLLDSLSCRRPCWVFAIIKPHTLLVKDLLLLHVERDYLPNSRRRMITAATVKFLHAAQSFDMARLRVMFRWRWRGPRHHSFQWSKLHSFITSTMARVKICCWHHIQHLQISAD